MVLLFEENAENGNIKTGGDALWWGIVTITTVGYGDRFPVTTLGRTTAFLVMLTGVGIIGALASILASLLVSSPAERAEATEVVEEVAAAEARERSTFSQDRGIADAVRSGAGALPASEPDAPTTDAILAKLADLQNEISSLRAELAVRPPRS